MTARSDFQGSRPSFDRANNVLGDDMAARPGLREQKIEQAAGRELIYRGGYVWEDAGNVTYSPTLQHEIRDVRLLTGR